MPAPTTKRLLLPGAAAAALAVLVVASSSYFGWGRRPPPPKPSEETALRGSVERAADGVFGATRLGTGDEKVTLSVPKERREAEAARLKDLAATLGGSAIATPTDDGNVDVLARVPTTAGLAFVQAARNPGTVPATGPAAGGTPSEFAWIDVLLQSPPAASSTP